MTIKVLENVSIEDKQLVLKLLEGFEKGIAEGSKQETLSIVISFAKENGITDVGKITEIVNLAQEVVKEKNLKKE